MNATARAAIAEAIGTFVFFTIGAGSIVIQDVTRNGDLLTVAFAHGIALAVVITVFGRFSGGHFNPAVTIGVWVGGKIKTVEAAVYVVAQLIGAVAAGGILAVIFTRAQWDPTHLGTPAVSRGIAPGKAVLVEAVLTFFLLLAVWGTGVDPKGPKVAGFAIGLTVFADILLGGPITGAAMNPARVFGPALVSGFWTNHWVYWVGPLAGGAIASLIYRTVFWEEEHPAGVQTAIAHDAPPQPPHDLP